MMDTAPPAEASNNLKRELLADQRASRGEWEAAARDYEALLALGSSTLDVDRRVCLGLKAARAWEQMGENARAIERYRAALRIDPRNGFLTARLRELLAQTGAWAALADLLREMVENRWAPPKNAAALYVEAAEILDERVGDEAQALELLRRAIVIEENPLALERAWGLARRRGELRDLALFLSRLAKEQFGPSDPKRSARLADRAAQILLHDLEDEEGAKEVLFRAARTLLADAQGEEVAFELLHRLFELDHDYPPLLRVLADYHRADGEPGEAARFFERYREAAPGALDLAVVELRLAQIALGCEEETSALAHLSEAVWGALPADEIPTARILTERLVARRPADPTVLELRRVLGWMELDPKRLEGELHRASLRAGADRAVWARRLGRLREVRLQDPEGAAVAYREALRASPADLQALGGAQRVLADQPATLLGLLCAAIAVTENPAVLGMLHQAAARAAAEAGLAEEEVEHRFQAFRLAPEEPGRRRQALRCLRETARWIDLLEVLREEARWGHRFAAAIEGAEVLAGPLSQPEAALPWAEEALRAATESGRAQEVERAQELLGRLVGGRKLAEEPAPVAAGSGPPPAGATEKSVRVVLQGEGGVHWKIPADTETAVSEGDGSGSDEADLLSAKRALARGIDLEGEQRLEEAAQAYEQALGARPRFAEALERLGQVCATLGRREEALSCLERLLYVVEDPRARARIRVRKAALALDREGAEQELRAALEGCGDDADTLDLCAETAASRDLPEIGALVEERRRRLER
jgi:tetratricopeptide (TPR) repeat protein